MTTMHDVAAHAHVSAKTVSRVFNNDPHVAPETRERILATMKALNYVPNSLAQNFRSGRAPVIGVAVPDIADPFFASLARGVEEIAVGRGMTVSVTSLGEDPVREEPVLESLLRFQLSGLIMAPISDNQAYLSRWTANTPVVFVDRGPTKLAVDSFVDDDRGGARTAVTHLIKHGHTRIAFVGDTVSIPTTHNRLDGYRQALADAGLEYDPELVVFDTKSLEGARAAVATLLSDNRSPTAIFSSNARCSMSLVPALQEAHQSNLALVGFGDFPMANALRPAMTVIDQDPTNLGRQAAIRIFDRVDNPTKRFRRKAILPVELIERASCLVPWD